MPWTRYVRRKFPHTGTALRAPTDITNTIVSTALQLTDDSINT